MKIVRSIVGVLLGAFVAVVVINAIEMVNFLIHRPTDGRTMMEQMAEMKEDPRVMKAWIDSLPASAMVALVLLWQTGAFLGGAVSALIAGRSRLLHAGIIGAFVLAGTILNIFELKSKLNYSHPDWLIIVALLLPIPASLIAGKLVEVLFGPAPGPPEVSPP